MAGNGELYDARGIPIYAGDLLRAVHFRDARGKRYYLYHVAVMRDGCLYGVPTQNLEPTMDGHGGTFRLTAEDAAVRTILHGFGPNECIDYEDRPRKKEEAMQ